MTDAAQQKDLFTKRWRRVRRLDPSEFQLQVSLLQHLKYRCRHDVLYWHTPNGELRDKRAAAKLQAMGVLPGVADLTFIWRSHYDALCNLYLELKARSRGLSPDQRAFGAAVIECGAYFEHADNIDDALRILKRYDILKV